MGGSSVQFQTPTALYQALAGQGQGGLFGATPFPQVDYGWEQNSPYFGILNGIQGLYPANVYKGPAAQDYTTSTIGSNTNALGAAGANLLPQATSMAPYIGQALTNAFDPQNALFKKLFQQQEDQSNAENAMAGVATTPYGAALTQQGNQNFDLAWQQQQLAREAQGAGTAAGLAGTEGSLLGAAGSAISAPANLVQQQIQDYMNYILANTQNSAAFTSGTNAATNAGANSTNALVNAQNAANSGKGGIGSALSGVGGLVGKLLPTGGKGP